MNDRTRNTMHNLRKSLKDTCKVCGAERFQRCFDPTPARGKLEWAEFKLFAAVHDLKELDPDHILVKAVEAVLESAEANPDQLSLDVSGIRAEE